jgi:penicillin-binding protein 2
MNPNEPQHPQEEGSQASFTPTITGRMYRDDARFALGRITVFQYAVVAVFLFLLSGFWYLQVYAHEANSELAERNRIKTVPVPAPRGKILDRDGRVIVDNHSSYTVMLSQETMKPEHLAPIAQALGLNLEDLQATVAKYAKGPRYVPIPLKSELTPAELGFVESHRDANSFPELEIVVAQKRLYPRDHFAAHILGYVGEVSEQELNTADFAKYSRGDTIGKFGLEREYNDVLTGVDGQRRVEVDVSGRERKILESQEAIPGQNLQLTIDLDVQAATELAMDGRNGAAVAIDPRTGEVLAMVSRPGFDPNAFGRLRSSEWNQLMSDPATPMLNRAIQGRYAPGSTFKPILAIAGLETGLITEDETVSCGGAANWYGNLFHCHSRHGVISMHRSLVQSCDVYFYNLGNRLKIDGIAEWANLSGLGAKTGIDLPGESEGLVPSTKWKLRTQRERWYPGETISVSIGQGALEVTPLQLASSIGGLATGGRWFTPHLVKTAAPPEPRSTAAWNPDNVAKVVSGMYGVVNEGGGTGTAAAIPGVTVSGKTGSAQRISNALVKANAAIAKEMQDNGWFVGFAPRDNPEIVVAVLVEAGIHGGSTAAPVTRDIIKAYFDKKTRSALQNPNDLAATLHLKR